MPKLRSLVLLIIAEVAAMSLWFVSAAVVGEMAEENPIGPSARAALSSAVQAGFVIGALASAFLGLADRFDPRRVFAASALVAAAANLGLLVAPIGGGFAIALRFLTGASLAGVYPVGMKIAIGWGKTDRGFLVGLLVGGLTLGSAAPHLLSWAGGADWRMTLTVASGLGLLAAVLVLFCRTGPFHAQSGSFDPRVITIAWTNRRIRAAYAGYLGHMWELYAMWAWIAVALSVSFSRHLEAGAAANLAKLITFFAIGAGAISSAVAGRIADRIGKAELTILAMTLSGLSALATAASFGGPVFISVICVLVWGITIIPDSAQFSALVADFAEPETAGSLLSLQTALGFALTAITVQVTPVLAEFLGWPIVLALLALGPLFGIAAMWSLRRRAESEQQVPAGNHRGS